MLFPRRHTSGDVPDVSSYFAFPSWTRWLTALAVLLAAVAFVWLSGSSNPFTPAGYVGYLTRSALIGKAHFYGVQRGPVSAGRRWLLDVTNVSITPYTYSEEFTGDDAVLSRDNLKIAFRVHTGWRIDETRVPMFMERFSTTVTRETVEKDPDAIVKVAYAHYVREPLRTFARDEVQRRNGLDVKEALIPIGDAVLARIRQYATNSPFLISSVVVGNIQYPAEVADAVSRKLAATQELQRKDTEIEIERKERVKREVQAQGIANSMQIIRGQLTAMYIQHEAIEAQKLMVNSPNHTVVYIPSGPMGVPLTGTFPATAPQGPSAPVRNPR
ncbi:MAG TPA: SPFH domain-containing protein [Vicinamibacterales bacterium]|nr:SPFH domain-containing protein [Vicinamibacterales bacterium]